EAKADVDRQLLLVHESTSDTAHLQTGVSCTQCCPADYSPLKDWTLGAGKGQSQLLRSLAQPDSGLETGSWLDSDPTSCHLPLKGAMSPGFRSSCDLDPGLVMMLNQVMDRGRREVLGSMDFSDEQRRGPGVPPTHTLTLLIII